MPEKDVLAHQLVTVLSPVLAKGNTEPFRLQQDLTLFVDFEEYVKFIANELGDDINWLQLPTAELKHRLNRHCAGDSTPLQNAWMIDVAIAQLIELSIAEAQGQGASGIRHSKADALTVTETSIDKMYTEGLLKEAELAVLKILNNLQFSLTKVSPVNRKHYVYAVYTYSCAMHNTVVTLN